MVETKTGECDRRTKLLYLTNKGYALENELFNELHENMARAYAAAGVKSVEGYWCLMQHLMSPVAHASFLIFNEVSYKIDSH